MNFSLAATMAGIRSVLTMRGVRPDSLSMNVRMLLFLHTNVPSRSFVTPFTRNAFSVVHAAGDSMKVIINEIASDGFPILCPS